MLDIYCVLSAALFVASRIVSYVTFAKAMHRSHFDFDAMREFDAAYLELEWNHRHDLKTLEIVGRTLSAVAWLVFAVPLLQVVWILSAQHGTQRLLGAHMAMFILVLGGTLAEFLSNLLFIGANETAIWLSQDFNMDSWANPGDGNGWRTLEAIHWIIRGMLLWVDAAEWLFMGLFYFLLFVSVHRASREGYPQQYFSVAWASTGVGLGALCFIDFTFNVLRLKDWMTFASLSGIISLIVGLFLFPLWLLWLGRQLAVAKRSQALASTPTGSGSKSMGGDKVVTGESHDLTMNEGTDGAFTEHVVS